MSYRAHGRAAVSPSKPQTHAICDRCGFECLHRDLSWQFDWVGPRLQNKRILVCRGCYDKPQEQLRTVVLPADPQPTLNPRPENYVAANNPVSALGFDPADLMVLPTPQRGANIGNMTLGGGVDAAFNQPSSAVNKPFAQCAVLFNSQSSFANTVGKNWAADPSGVLATLPSSVPATAHTVSAFTLVAPNDAPFLASGATGLWFQGSANNATWTTLYSTTTAGTVGEVLTSLASNLTAAPFQYHRAVLQGDGVSRVGIAQLVLSISDGAVEP